MICKINKPLYQVSMNIMHTYDLIHVVNTSCHLMIFYLIEVEMNNVYLYNYIMNLRVFAHRLTSLQVQLYKSHFVPYF